MIETLIEEVKERWGDLRAANYNMYFGSRENCGHKNALPEEEADQEVYDFLATSLRSAYLKGLEDAEKEITKLLNSFANTPIEERGTGWDWILEAQMSLAALKEQAGQVDKSA